MKFDFYLPVELHFGRGVFLEAAEYAAKLGNRCLIVCDPFISGVGLAEKLKSNLADKGVYSLVYDKVCPNPTTLLIDEGALLALKEDCDFLIGIGGGSSMDTAKGIAVASRHDGEIWPYAIGEKEINGNVLPVMAIPTTSGTGSHCTCFSVISNPETMQKPGMGSPHILPKIAIVDPELMLTAPAALTLSSGFDVLTHAIEAYTSNASSPMSDIFAEKALKLAASNLRKVCDDSSDIEARSAMALADTCAGIAICHAVVTLPHVIAHVIGGHFHDIAHGDALASIYSEAIKFNSSALTEKHKFIANALDDGNNDVVSAFDKFIGQFDFENKLKKKYAEDKSISRRIAQDVFTYMKGVADLNPVSAAEEDVENILEKSLA